MTREAFERYWNSLSVDERDAALADFLMGWHPGDDGQQLWLDANGKETGFRYGSREQYYGWMPNWAPTQEFESAGEALKKLAELQRHIEVVFDSFALLTDPASDEPDAHGPAWICRFTDAELDYWSNLRAISSSPTEAIAKAALLVMMYTKG